MYVIDYRENNHPVRLHSFCPRRPECSETDFLEGAVGRWIRTKRRGFGAETAEVILIFWMHSISMLDCFWR